MVSGLRELFKRGGVTRIVLLGGAPASGKSSCCAELTARGFVCLDKDLLAGRLVEAALSGAGEDVGRRDSELYTEKLRPLEYEALLSQAQAVVSSGHSVVLDAPFLLEVQQADYLERLRERFEGAEVQLVWLDCPQEVLAQRMSRRGLARDQGKIEGCEIYTHPLPPRRMATLVLDSSRLSSSELADQVERLLR